MEIRHLIDKLDAVGSVELACLTDEEMASINADENTPFRPAGPPGRLNSLSAEARIAVLRTALRSLVARGLIQAPDDEATGNAATGMSLPLRPLGELENILAVRRAPSAVVFVGQTSYLGALHGFKEERVSGFLEERIDNRGLHYFTLRTVEHAIEAVARLADPSGQVPATGSALSETGSEPPDDVTKALRELGPGVTRIDAYHSRPAGTRRIQVAILVRPGVAHIVSSAFGVAPDKPRYAAVNDEGLRRALQDALCDPGADVSVGQPGSDVTTQDGPPYRCPVCGYVGLEEPPRTEESGPSYEICPSCGFEFGVTDDDRGISYEHRRAEWVAGGMRWWSRRPIPTGWDPRAQLRELL